MNTPDASVKILVIDDSDSIRRLIAKVLNIHGYEVITAGTALEGLDLAQKEHPQMVICDVQMPGHDGYHVLQELRQDRRFQLIPFIFVSGEAVHRHDVRKGMTRGADDYLFKPFTPQELVEAVNIRLERHALVRQVQANPLELDLLRPYAQLEQDLKQLLQANENRTVVTLDIDRFKRLNDALGFQSADQLLHQLLQRFEDVTAYNVTLYHGPRADQIFLITPALKRADMEDLAQNLLSLVSEPLNFQGYQLHLTCSIGLHRINGDSSVEEVLKKAYIAMNQAKQQGGNYFMVYKQDMHTTVTRQLTWENELHQALSHRWFVLHYQPQLDLISGEVMGAEALIRIKHPELGLIYPGDFIQIAEETGLIAPIGDWCLRESCRQVKQWHDQGYTQMRVAVNVSVLQFQQGRFAERVAEILKSHQLDGRFLEIELTESALVRDIESIQTDLQALRDMQVSLAIDDFGTGYSSLSYLRHLPFDQIKIDQSFVRGMTDTSASLAIPKAIIDMGHSLGLGVLAEGIETQQQMLLLKSYGCDLGQGFFIGRPMPAEKMTEFMTQHPMPA